MFIRFVALVPNIPLLSKNKIRHLNVEFKKICHPSQES